MDNNNTGSPNVPRLRAGIPLIIVIVLGIPVGGIAAGATSARAEPQTTIIRPFQLDSSDPSRSGIGALVWRGGLEIIHLEPRFGGLSGLHVSPDGRRMTAVTDRGSWVTANLIYRRNMLTGLTRIKVGNLKGQRSDRLPGSWRDAESLSPDGSGGFLVTFERRHRIWRYAQRGGGGALTGRPRPVDGPAEIESQPHNGGIEAFTRLCDGRLLALSEELRAGPGSYRGWIRAAHGWSALAYGSKGQFRPTGATTLPDCDVVVVERHFNILTGVRARLVRIAAGVIGPGTMLLGEELAELAAPLNVDNMEAVAARRGENGETLLYVISDDNFSGLQRTLLFLFALPSAGAAPAGG